MDETIIENKKLGKIEKEFKAVQGVLNIDIRGDVIPILATRIKPILSIDKKDRESDVVSSKFNSTDESNSSMLNHLRQLKYDLYNMRDYLRELTDRIEL